MHTMRAIAAVAISTLLLFAPCSGVDGIAVSTQINVFLWGTNGEMQAGGDIMRYDISANRIVKTTKLFDGAGGDGARARSRARFPAINVEGTKIAFYRITTDSGSFVSVLNIDGTGMHDLARIPSQTGYDGTGYLHWMRQGADEWVYYSMAGGNFTKAGNKLLWRVNAANPAQNEQVVAFQYYLWQWGLSADGAKVFLRLSENQPIGQTFRYLMPGNGSIDTRMSVAFGSGCGVALSPSGLYLMYMQGGTHNYFCVDDWANNDPAVHVLNITSVDINAWAFNGSANFTTSCPDWGTVVVGVGMSCNRWSCNSDKWLCLCMGWPDAGSGMFTMCGSNQVLCNWKDKVTVMASSNPRMCFDSSARANCDKNLPFVSGQFYQNDAGDFWCTTAEDINQDLRQYVNIRANSPVVRGAMPVAACRADNRLVIDIKQRGSFRAIVRNCAGQTLFTLRGMGPLRRTIPAGPGVYFMSVMINDRKVGFSSVL
jgi:hypothetical protein